jgi:glutamate dehydrogenase
MLDREIESLPSTEQLAERQRTGRGMARPELCILLAYAKRSLEEAIRSSSFPDDPYLERDLRRYFPARVIERFGDDLPRHPLRRELASTIIANEVVNDLGITFVSRLCSETGAEPAEVARAFYIARDVCDAADRWAEIEALDGVIDPVVQNDLMVGVDTLVADLSRWYLLNAPSAPLGEMIASAKPPFHQLAAVIDQVGSDSWRALRERTAGELVSEGVREEIARRHAFQAQLAHTPDIAAVAAQTGRTIEEVATAFFLAGERLHVDWLERELDEVPATSNWQRWAAQAVADDLMTLRRDIALRALQGGDHGSVESSLDAYVASRAEAVDRFERLIDSFEQQEEPSLAAITVALRQIRSLVG